MPVFGFNSNVRVSGIVFHVQTEDRGANNPVLDTTIYVKGRVLAKRANSYQDFLVSPDFNESELHAMLERQHKEILEAVRAGTLPEMVEFRQTEGSPPRGLKLQLLNPGSFVKGATGRLEVAAATKQGAEPLGGVTVRLMVRSGAAAPATYEATTDPAGKAAVEFPMPRVGPDGIELVLKAGSRDGQDEIKYAIRPKPKPAS